MRPLPFSGLHAVVFWPAYLWAFWPEWRLIKRTRAGAKRPDSRDAGSLRLILIGQMLGLTASFPLAFFAGTALTGWLRPAAFWLGLALLVGGSLLRRHCFALLGEHFTGDVRASPDQPVVDRGAYRWIRHPAYLAGLLMFGGIGLALGNWGSFVQLAVSSVAVYHVRMRVEEAALEAVLGERYLEYKRTRKRLIPFVY